MPIVDSAVIMARVELYNDRADTQSPLATAREIALPATLPKLKLESESHDGIAEMTSHWPYCSGPKNHRSSGMMAIR